MKTRKFLAILLALSLLCAFLCGCDASIDVYEQQSDDAWHFSIEVRIPTASVKGMESSATVNHDTGKKWTVDEWLNAYFEEISDGYGMSYAFWGTENEASSNQKKYTFELLAEKKEVRDDLSEGLTLTGDTSVKTNLFIRTIRVVRDDRFNYWINQFEDAYARYEKNEAAAMDVQTAMGILLFGCVVNSVDPDTGEMVARSTFPGIFEAFPAAKELPGDYRDIVLRNFWYASSKMQVAADDVYGVEGDSKHAYYLFQKTVGDGETDVDYVYFRADPTGWYIVAIVLGLAVVGIVLLVVLWRKKHSNKLPPAKVQDDFPYDPFAEYNNNNNSNDNNPFEGY